MCDLVRRVVNAHGLDHTLFNVELLYDATADRIGIVEINPRLCGQFADLYQKVDGTNTYEAALALAVGRRPNVHHREGAHRFAASLPLRVFTPSRVLRAPSPDDVRAAEALFPGTLIWVECEAEQDLCNFEHAEDGCSARYAIVNAGAADRERLAEHFEAIQSRLGFTFEPLLSVAPAAISARLR
jgi:biotin carboxylase